MIGDENQQQGMMVHVPPWSLIDDPLTGISPFSPRSPNTTVNSSLTSFEDYAYLLRNDAALRRYLELDEFDGDGSFTGCTDFDITSETFACDSFRMYEFKIRKCTRPQSHDWTDCPYVHPGEKARRRDPRKYSYSGTACPEFRKGNCKKGDSCEFAHGVFECWLHPNRYRTQPCKDGVNCRRRVCFFAHSPDQLRPHTDSGFSAFLSSQSETSTPPSESPPMSPMDGYLSRSLGSVPVSDMLSSLRRLQLNKPTSMGTPWSMQVGRVVSSPGTGFYSLPSTPTRPVTRSGLGFSDQIWEEEEPALERVESGRVLRAKMFEKLSKENPMNRVDPSPGESSNPDVGWISELVK